MGCIARKRWSESAREHKGMKLKSRKKSNERDTETKIAGGEPCLDSYHIKKNTPLFYLCIGTQGQVLLLYSYRHRHLHTCTITTTCLIFVFHWKTEHIKYSLMHFTHVHEKQLTNSQTHDEWVSAPDAVACVLEQSTPMPTGTSMLFGA